MEFASRRRRLDAAVEPLTAAEQSAPLRDMNRSDPGPEGRVLTLAVGLGVAVAGLVFVVLALRHDSAGQRTSEAQSSPTESVGPVG
jgi:hypothetical protein